MDSTDHAGRRIFGGETEMSGDRRKFFSADTLERAILAAASQFGIDPERVAYQRVEKKQGFVRSARRFLIEVDSSRPEREPDVAARESLGARIGAEATAPGVGMSAPGGALRTEKRERQGVRAARVERGGERRGRESRQGAWARRSTLEPSASELVPLLEKPRRLSERFPPLSGDIATALSEECARLLGVAGLRLEAAVLKGEDELLVDLSGADGEACFRDSGELLHALEHLLPRLVRSRTGSAVSCRVDCDSFHEIREEQIRSLAQRVAEEAVREGSPKILEAMNPSDRRLVHLALADDSTVSTGSEGDGYFKRVVVRPS